MANDKKPRRGGMAGFATFAANTEDLARRSTEGELLDRASPTAAAPPAAGIRPAGPPPAAGEQATEDSSAPVEAGRQTAPTNGRPIHVVPQQEPSASPPVTPARSPRQSKERFPRPVAGPEGRLEASGEPIVKWTIELAPQLVHALAVWERDETRRTGQRVFRERVVDIALDLLPDQAAPVNELVKALPEPLRTGKGELFSTRVRSSVRERLLALRPELRVVGIKDVRMRDIYSAGLYRYLTGLGVKIEL